RRSQQRLTSLLSALARTSDDLFVLRAAAAARPIPHPRPAARHQARPSAHKGKGRPEGLAVVDGLIVLDEVTGQRFSLGEGDGRLGPPDSRGRRSIEVPASDAHIPLPLLWALAIDASGHTVGAAPLRLAGEQLVGDLDTVGEVTRVGLTREPFDRPGATDLRVALDATRSARRAVRSAVVDTSPNATLHRAALDAVVGFLALGMVRRARSLRELITHDDLVETFGGSAPDVQVVLAADPAEVGVAGWGGSDVVRPLWWWVASDAELGEEPPSA
ncbi:MAG TPA: hypothetical protein VK507_23305, partial [Iamia sp.]|nr:hypothetical protein [Iamia sp.]